MINSKEVLYSKGNNDECMTPNYGVEPIIKYIQKTQWFGVRLIKKIVNLLNK